MTQNNAIKRMFVLSVWHKTLKFDPHPEIMVPLIGSINELKQQKETIKKTSKEVFAEENVSLEFEIGTMIEIPRAALTAAQTAVEE